MIRTYNDRDRRERLEYVMDDRYQRNHHVIRQGTLRVADRHPVRMISQSEDFMVFAEVWDEQSRESGETDRKGVVQSNISLTDAVRHLGHTADQFGGHHTGLYGTAYWVRNNEYRECYQSGDTEIRTLHFPPTMSEARCRRIARILGVPNA